MVAHPVRGGIVGVQFPPPRPFWLVGVTVSTADCQSVSRGSTPLRAAKFIPSDPQGVGDGC